MPLLDHFRPPWSVQRPWEGFHGAWAANIAFHLNSGLLPADYFAMPLLEVAGRVEVDVAAFTDPTAPGPTTPAVWAPPPPVVSLPLDAAGESFEVQVSRNFGGPQLRAAIELVSPANKDRPAARRAFAAKCAAHLRRGVSVVIVDVVTDRSANLHADILSALDPAGPAGWASPSGLYAVSYRGVVGADPPRLEAWPHALALGAALPELPLWLETDLCLPLRFEESYAVTCGALRMRG